MDLDKILPLVDVGKLVIIELENVDKEFRKSIGAVDNIYYYNPNFQTFVNYENGIICDDNEVATSLILRGGRRLGYSSETRHPESFVYQLTGANIFLSIAPAWTCENVREEFLIFINSTLSDYTWQSRNTQSQ